MGTAGKHIHAIMLSVIAVFCLTGCVKEMNHLSFDSEYIVFTASVSDVGTKADGAADSVSGLIGTQEQAWPVEAATKAAPVTQLTGSAGVIAYQNGSDGWALWDRIQKAEYVFDGNMLEGEPILWRDAPETDMKFYAYAPYDKLSPSLDGKSPVISYTAVKEVADQTDIIAADKEVTVASTGNQSVALEFNHILTAVRFKLGFGSKVKVTSVKLSGVYGKGEFDMATGTWNATESSDYEISADKTLDAGGFINDGEQTLMLIPQTLPEGASVTLTYNDGTEKTLTASLAGKVWQPGRMVTYTLYETNRSVNTIYFDLAAGDVDINDTYKGWIYVNGVLTEVAGDHVDANVYYVYQSTGGEEGNYDKDHTGWVSAIGEGECRIPEYAAVTYGGKTWAEYVTDNQVVEDVIHAWDDKESTGNTAVRSVGRRYTDYRVHISGSHEYNLTIDDIYSRFHDNHQLRTTGTIAFYPLGNSSRLKINMVGDSRVGCVQYSNGTTGNELVFEGNGSLTVADADYNNLTWSTNKSEYIGVAQITETTYVSNHWNSAIGNSDHGDNSLGIIINSGTIFAGTTAAENCSAIGGGGNGTGKVTINGGNVTAVATTTGTAIGGGIGFQSSGGYGDVTINGGNVYAYNHANKWKIPSAAIGGAGSSASVGNIGKVTITGGNVYAQTALGTAIGGGSSKTRNGGGAEVTITGGNVIAKSLADGNISAGAGIGGGTGCSGGVQPDADVNVDGGKATIKIFGNPVIRTGSIGGGKCGHPSRGKIGTADITVSGGDIQAQFVMAAGASTAPRFTMSGGVIRNSNTDDAADEFYNIVKPGGAVYMEDGTFEMTSGVIRDCSATYGGAVYIKKGKQSATPPVFKMSGGEILSCRASADGGAVYLEDGSVNVSGTALVNHCSAVRGGALCVIKTAEASSVPEFGMSGGDLSENVASVAGGAVFLEGGTVTLSGGSISGNLVQDGNGGGVCISGGSFTMPSGGSAAIKENSALSVKGTAGDGYGGGVHVASETDGVKVELFSGSVTNNSSARYGGGVSVNMKTGVEASVTVGADGSTVGPVISGNLTLHQGGGLYVNGNMADVVINSGKISGNQTSGYVANPDVVNNDGMVTLNGGEVASNSVTYDGNGGTYQNADTYVQKIVTDTKNRLQAPSFTRTGYTFERWNTRADGLGIDYTGDEVVIRSTDLTLYAIWKL